MVGVNSFSIMELSTRANLKMVESMAQVQRPTQAEPHMMASGAEGRNLAREPMSMQMVTSMKANGKKTGSMERGSTTMLMVLCTKDGL